MRCHRLHGIERRPWRSGNSPSHHPVLVIVVALLLPKPPPIVRTLSQRLRGRHCYRWFCCGKVRLRSSHSRMGIWGQVRWRRKALLPVRRARRGRRSRGGAGGLQIRVPIWSDHERTHRVHGGEFSWELGEVLRWGWGEGREVIVVPSPDLDLIFVFIIWSPIIVTRSNPQPPSGHKPSRIASTAETGESMIIKRREESLCSPH